MIRDGKSECLWRDFYTVKSSRESKYFFFFALLSTTS
jgi:hypothetical protein